MTAESAELIRDGAVSSSRWSERTLPLCVSALVLLIVGVGILSALAAGPLHAQCAVEWYVNRNKHKRADNNSASQIRVRLDTLLSCRNIGIPCFDVSALLVNQIKEWSTETCTGTSQRCRYSLTTVNADDITATHTTPVMRFVDDLTFNLSSPHPDTCDVQGRSVSRSWYAMFDGGTNYLNMYNLMRGSGLFSSPSFTESTSDRLCTQFSSTRQNLPP
ncbi:uncharacterized protein LOC130427524 isoform X1 [Triplophysa dalaica]|uniref:uncharacterized protein LOC130427524 isoform X1 n=1 Tax=Triplophysa dalaica TaxID=1582913 RepID=UPI0024DF497E|nr:uncharacterized protein LOC130427524 isoform X1 [Triplophysa dalaica]